MIGPALLAAIAGVSVWLSLGTMAVIDDRTMARIAAFPPMWWLGAIVVIAVTVAVVVRFSMAKAWPLLISTIVWLPFLPFPVPSALLIWSGPLEGAVWLAVGAGVLFSPPSAALDRIRTWTGDPRRAPWLAGAVVVVCSTLALVSMEGVVPAGDEPHYLVLAQSLLTDGDLRIENNHKRGDYLPYFRGDLAKADYIVRGVDGQIYPIHPPGISALVVPGFAVAGYHGAVATVIGFTAVASALAWQTAWLLTASVGGAWFAWAAVFLTAPYFIHTFTIYPDGVGGLLATVGIWLLVQLEMGVVVNRLTLAFCGSALALLPWFHTRFAILAAMFGVTLVGRLLGNSEGLPPRTRWPSIGWLLAVPLISSIAWFSYFWIIWGTPNPAAPYGTETNTAIANIGRGLTGLLVDQQFGLIANAPIYAVAVLGLVSLARQRMRLAIELVAITLPYLMAAAAFHMWWGGVSAPARFAAALMPVAALPLAWWWSTGRTTASRAFGLAVLLLSVSMVIPLVAVEHGTMVYNDRDGFDLLLDWAARSVDLPMAFPAVHRGTTEWALADAGVWVFGGVLLLAVAHLLTRSRIRSAGAMWAIIAWSAALIAMMSSTAVWAMHHEPGLTMNRSQVALLANWLPDTQTTLVRLRPFRQISRDEFVRQIEVGSTARVRAAHEGPSYGRPNASDPTMLAAHALPAGDYEVVFKGGGAPSGQIFVWVGRTELATEAWRLEGRQPGFSGLIIHLPVPAGTLVIRGDPEALASIPDLTLRPRLLRPSADPESRAARTSTRYGNARVFFMDNRAYMENGGFWTRGDATTMVVIDTRSGNPEGLPPPAVGLPILWLQSGPIATTADLSIGNWREHVDLPAQSRKSVALPPLSGADNWVLTIRSGPAFRPSEQTPGNRDARPLGVWVELR